VLRGVNDDPALAWLGRGRQRLPLDDRDLCRSRLRFAAWRRRAILPGLRRRSARLDWFRHGVASFLDAPDAEKFSTETSFASWNFATVASLTTNEERPRLSASQTLSRTAEPGSVFARRPERFRTAVVYEFDVALSSDEC